MQLKAMTPEEKQKMDHAIYRNVFECSDLANAEFLYGYMDLSWEAGTKEILERLWSTGVQVALPKVLGDTMEFFHVRSKDDLQEGTFHILEPKEHCQQICWPNAPVLVPGLAFSKDGKRLGKGGGYYDKLLSNEPDHRTIALCYEFQMTDEIPSEAHDQMVEIIVTEKDIYHVGKI